LRSRPRKCIGGESLRPIGRIRRSDCITRKGRRYLEKSSGEVNAGRARSSLLLPTRIFKNALVGYHCGR
jgi:hypothetical protein